MADRRSEWVAPYLDINEKLPPGQFLKRGFNASRIQGRTFIVRGLSPAEFQKLIARAAAEDPWVEAVFYSSEDLGLRDLQAMAGPTLNTFAVSGYLEYWGRSTSATRIPITGTGVLRETANCVPSAK
jgi:hypothetical protein